MSKVKAHVIGYPPSNCDVCQSPLDIDSPVYDAATKLGPWGWLCPTCFRAHGMGLGKGIGQEYGFNGIEWEKTSG